jgi:hypothetical protein
MKESKKLSRSLATENFEAGIALMGKVTDALKRALWGMEWLENFDRTLQLTETEIKIAVTYVEENLSKVAITTS